MNAEQNKSLHTSSDRISVVKHQWHVRQRGPHRVTLLQSFLDRRGIVAAHVEARLAERLEAEGLRPPSRNRWIRWRLGRTDMGRKDMVRVLWAVREVAHDPTIGIEDLYDFDPATPDIWRD
ncbi:MAG TPA: hypothetical protein VEK11_26390 [Thermoanaerobaculia bacterium]|jgi:hypothetical protein|nr:hypothetical protein [Thermoanaerobaculia bacterium]